MTEYDLEDIIHTDSGAIFSDPESEWTGTIKVEEPEDELYDLQPESERSSELLRLQIKDYKIPGFTYDEMHT